MGVKKKKTAMAQWEPQQCAMRFLAKHEMYVWWRRLVKSGRWRIGVEGVNVR
jgi:uncharacterized cysteine cluster protein YcgN (CxxCxxCC family)